MAVEFVTPKDENKRTDTPSEDVVIDNILKSFDSSGEFIPRGDNLRFYRKNERYFDLMKSEYNLIYTRTQLSICLTRFGDKVRSVGGWLKYLELRDIEEKKEKEKANETEKLNLKLKKSAIRVNELLIENSEQNKRIADLTEINLKLENENIEYQNSLREKREKIEDLNTQSAKLQIKLNKWIIFKQYWWLTATIYALIVNIIAGIILLITIPETTSLLLKQILRLILRQ